MTNLERLLKVAEAWQKHHTRGVGSIMDKIEDEIKEYREISNISSFLLDNANISKLDEIGDVLVNALRLLSTLTTQEVSFIVCNSEMKAGRRLVNPGIKDKNEEWVETKIIASECGVGE